ncbi:MAG: nucleotide-binding domain containing protein, partial [Egibacteraceae bacterium]
AVVRGLVDRCDLGGLYVTGGDVTGAILGALGARGIAVDRELAPLVVAGWLAGGCADGLSLVTKGGLVGDAVTTVAALEHLRLRARRYDP